MAADGNGKGGGLDLGFDPASLKAKYLAERDKRLRADGNEQYVEMKGKYAVYLEDPYVKREDRAPKTDEVDVVVVGGGFGGLLAGARLREAGVESVRMIEKGGDFGGTWYWNRYPGAACDIESYIYLPLLEETGYMPVEKYTRAPEILAHCRRIAEHFDLYRDVLFQTEVTELRWDEASSRWTVKTNRGDEIKARFITMGTGPLHRPKLPGIPGLDDFKGHTFHTSRWDYDYTGGDPYGKLEGLKDKRVAIIGTGATAVQCVPHLGEGAKELFVFQRTPSSIDVRANRPTDPDWEKNLKPGWQQHRMDNFNTLVSGGFAEEDLVSDGWTDIIRNLMIISVARQNAGDNAPANPAELLQLADFKKMESIRARVDSVVKDAATAEALKPYYNQFCKRPCFHDEYLDTFNRDSVTLVDTQGKGVERITENGIVANGKEYKVDCIVFATGFEVGTSYTRRAGFEMYGRGGVALSDKWSNGVRTLHGMHARDFPNAFIIGNSQAGFTANYPHMTGEQCKHFAYIISECLKSQVRRLEVTEEAEEEWVQKILSMAPMAGKFQEECTPGYYNNEGKTTGVNRQNGSYALGPMAFLKVLAEWREDGTMKGLELTRS
jgi:cyclohexanone monooxygenase